MSQGQSLVLSFFHAAFFSIDGELGTHGKVEVANLSARWLAVCREILREHGSSFRIKLQGPLGHIGVKLTSDNGTGLGTFYVHDKPVLSTAYLSGVSPALDSEVQAMFIASLRGTDAVMNCASTPLPFEGIREIVGRPLQVAVPWPVGATDKEYEQVRELSAHFAASFFSGV
jgi:hypothetical protein